MVNWQANTTLTNYYNLYHSTNINYFWKKFASHISSSWIVQCYVTIVLEIKSYFVMSIISISQWIHELYRIWQSHLLLIITYSEKWALFYYVMSSLFCKMSVVASKIGFEHKIYISNRNVCGKRSPYTQISLVPELNVTTY